MLIQLVKCVCAECEKEFYSEDKFNPICEECLCAMDDYEDAD